MDADGSVLGWLASLQDVTDEVLAKRELDVPQERLLFLAQHDPLTGLLNRATTIDRIDGAVVRHDRGGPPPAVLFCDLDGFKQIDDTLGHATGECVRSVHEHLSARTLAVPLDTTIGDGRMGLLHRKEEGPPVRRFQMRARLLSVGDDYWIEDEQGQRAFLVDGKALRVRDTWVLKDAAGNEVAEIKEKKLSIRDKITIHAGGREATVKKELVSIRDKFHVDVAGESDLTVKGNIVDHEYKIERDGDKIAEISKKWFRVRDTYGIEVEPGVDPVLMIAVTVAVDAMTDGPVD